MTVRELAACLEDVPEAQKDDLVLLGGGREVEALYPSKSYDGRYPFKMYEPGRFAWTLSG